MPSLHKTVTPELALTALLSRPRLNQEQRDAAERLLQSADLMTLQHLIRHHRIWPCVHANLQAHFPERLSDPALRFLVKKHQQNARQARRTFELCGRLLRRMKESGVEARVFKGAPLAFRLYGDITKRNAHDLDLVIPAQALETAHRILTEEGCTCTQFDALSESQKALYLVAHKDIVYQSGTTLIELHLRLLAFRTELTEHYLTTLFSQPPQEEKQAAELIYLCWHGSHTLFHRLKWLVDITLYLEQNFADNADGLINLACELKAMRILTVCWVLSNLIFETGVPERVSVFYQRDLAARMLVARCVKQLNQPKTIESLRFKLERLCCEPLLYQNGSEKCAALSYKFKPTALDFGTIENIPAGLSFLYYPIRPFLFFYRRLANKPKSRPKSL